MTDLAEQSLGAPFDRIFGDLERADRFREFFAYALDRLAIDDPKHPLLTVSLRGRRLHVSYGMWLVLSALGSSTGLVRVGFVMFADQEAVPSPLDVSGMFAKSDAREPDAQVVYVSDTGLADLDLRPNAPFEAAYGAALSHVLEKFRSRSGTPWRKAHLPELVTAARDPESWRQLLLAGHVRDANSGFWWVNQGESYDLERGQGVLWARSAMSGAARPRHHANVGRVETDDVVFHNAGQAIRAISIATSNPEEAPRPGDTQEVSGTLVRTTIYELEPPMPVNELPSAVRTAKSGAFDKNGRPKQGYLWPLTEKAATAILRAVHPRLPAAAVDALADRLPNDEPRVWLFQANPKRWSLTDFLAEHGPGAVVDFTASRYADLIQQGDTALMWQAGETSGLFAVARVASDAYQGELEGQTGTTVDLRIEQVLASPISRTTFVEHPVLSGSQIIRAPQGTVFRVSPEEWTAVQHLMAPTANREALNAAYDLSEVSEATGVPGSELARWLRGIERRKQAIIYGPPGTGKTFVAKHLAKHLVAGGDGIIDLIQFHPAYTYEDFIQGLRPVEAGDGGLTYRTEPGRFTQFLERATDRSGKSVLIIDEINRANLARVFGELMYLLEYRDESMPLATGGELSIPANVRILATMNTADRSIALVDHALRRRFAFLPLRPQFDVLRRFHDGLPGEPLVEPLILVLRELHAEIRDRNLHLGISYFLVPDLPTQLDDIWRTEIEPYLEELFFDRDDPLGRFAWSRLEERFAGLP